MPRASEGWEHIGGGIQRKPSKRNGKYLYKFRVSWNGKRFDESGYTSKKEAEEAKGGYLEQTRKGTYRTPTERKQDAKTRQQQLVVQEAKREDLLFEGVVKQFVAKEGKGYADPKEVENRYKRLGLFFNGRYLDEIDRSDVEQFFDHRLNRRGVYHKFTGRKVGLRTPQIERVSLSVLYEFMIDHGHDGLDNPCIGRGRRRVKKNSETYRPARKKVIPSEQALRAIFDTPPEHIKGDYGKRFQALKVLAYYTGGRPESELCKLRHGDVMLPTEFTVVGQEPRLGTVEFTETKNKGSDRVVPLHPEAAKALREIMLPSPQGEAARKRWAATYVFPRTTKKGKALPWNRDSYKAAWKGTLKALSKEYPELRGMVLRDMRSTFKTVLVNAPEPPLPELIKCLMGHASKSAADSYYEMQTAAAERAIRKLTVRKAEAFSPAQFPHNSPTSSGARRAGGESA